MLKRERFTASMEVSISSVEEQRTPSLSVNLGEDLGQLKIVGLRGRGVPVDAELVILLLQTDRDSHGLCYHFSSIRNIRPSWIGSVHLPGT